MSAEVNWKKTSPLAERGQLRVCQLRAVGTDSGSASDEALSIADTLEFGRLEEHLAAAGPIAPTVVAAADRPLLDVDGRKTQWQRFRIRAAAGQLVDLRMFATEWRSVEDTIGLLESLYYGDLTGEPNEWDFSVDGVGPPFDPGSAYPFHQLVFIPDSEPEPSWETVHRLIYRADLDAIEEQSSIGHPAEINRRPGQLAAVGSFGSVLWAVQDYIKSSATLSAALTVAALECTRTVRLEAVERYQNRGSSPAAVGEQARSIQELEAELTFGAEAASTILPLLQSLRVDEYHKTLIDSANVIPDAALVARMLDRLNSVI